MFIKSILKCEEFTAGDETLLREVLAPARDGIDIRYSLARARLLAGTKSLPHRLMGSEVYVFLEGQGTMSISGARRRVVAGDVVYTPPGALQHVENDGEGDLVFLCIVDPAWREADEQILPQ
jgi:mannose-6-phosphate isomerase-like protein (cupin superfamily)